MAAAMPVAAVGIHGLSSARHIEGTCPARTMRTGSPQDCFVSHEENTHERHSELESNAIRSFTTSAFNSLDFSVIGPKPFALRIASCVVITAPSSRRSASEMGGGSMFMSL